MPTPERTSLAEIVDAGRTILEESGPVGLTMQAVASRVGVRAPSLYKRVKDRAALLEAVAAATIEDLTLRLDECGDDLAGLAREYRTYARERPEGFRLMFSPAAPQDAIDRAAGPILRAAAARVGDDEALDAARLFTAWTTGFLQMELSASFRLGGDVDQAFEYGLRHLLTSLVRHDVP